MIESSENPIETYCIIGDPIDRSLSPVMFNTAFNSIGRRSTYIAFRVPKGELQSSLHSLKVTKISGFNVTIPHKVDILPNMEILHSAARKANAVNTVRNVEGRFEGYNTDVQGFIEPLNRRHISLNGMNILLIGSGGAARAIVTALSDKGGISQLVIVNRTPVNAMDLLTLASNVGLKAKTATFENLGALALNSDLIINSTPPGSDFTKSQLDHEHIRRDSVVYDIVYVPMVTNLLEQARIAQASIIYGYEMLLAQGAKAFEIWTGLDAPVGVMKKALLGPFGEPS